MAQHVRVNFQQSLTVDGHSSRLHIDPTRLDHLSQRRGTIDEVRSHPLGPFSAEEKHLLGPDTAQAVAVTLHELATNAVKYGALSTANGHIDLKWSHEANGRLNLRWIETGGPTVQSPTRRGFGGPVIEQMIAQLKGESRFDWHTEGLVCEITLRV
jgi:two-component sensor histidine kinase